MQILGVLLGVDLIGAVIRLVKNGVRSSFPPKRQGGKERTLRFGSVGVEKLFVTCAGKDSLKL